MIPVACLLTILSHAVLSSGEQNITRNRIIIFPQLEDAGRSSSEQDLELWFPEEEEKSLTTDASEKAWLYSDWSEWSSCSDSCQQTRKKRCKKRRACGDAVIKETRSCPTEHNKRHKRKCRRVLRDHHHPEHKHKQPSFNLVRAFNHPGLQSSGISTRQTYRPSRTDRLSRLAIVDSGVRPQDSGGAREVYGKWGPWANCSKSCTTRRYRWCKRRDVCGDQIHKESAYCYVEGTYCQEWIHRKIQQSENEADVDFHIESYRGRRGRGKVAKNKTESAHAQNKQEFECGIVFNTNTRKRWPTTRIIGGRPTLKGRWPWQVAVLNRYKEAFCGGTLVAPQWVLTAAHCIRKRLYVRLGEHDLSKTEGTEMEVRVSQMISHPSYDPETVDNDVALLRLPVAVKPDRYRSLACLPKPKQHPPIGQFCTIIGWGKRRSSDSFGTDVLHEAQVPVVSNDVCRLVYEDYHITRNMFCAGYQRGRMDSCAGDSGGPLLCKVGPRWTIFGITSFGEGCGKRGKYGIYTRLPNYVRWIQKTIKHRGR